MGETIHVLSQNTLVPISLVVLISSVVIYLTKLESKILRNAEKILDLTNELNAHLERDFEMHQKLDDKLEEIDRRLTLIQGSIKGSRRE